MTIRGSVNQSIKGNVAFVATETRELALGGVDEANAVLVEHRERLDTPPAFLTTVPGGSHNGTLE